MNVVEEVLPGSLDGVSDGRFIWGRWSVANTGEKQKRENHDCDNTEQEGAVSCFVVGHSA
jgi:hypothetical protein